MKIRRSAPAVLIATVALVLAVTGLVQSRMSEELIDSVEASRFELMRSIVINGLADAEGKALARAELVASLPSIQAHLRAGEREAMLDETRAMFEVQRDRFGVDQAQFFTYPTISFLRINAPEKFGDDVSGFRPMIVEVEKSRESLKGLSISRSGPAIFGVAPISDAQGDVGMFEFGLDFAAVLDGIKAKYGLDCALFIDEKPLREVATGLSGDVLSDQNRVGKYMRVHTTHVDRMKELVTDRDLGSGERMLVKDAAGVPYGVLVLPLETFSGKPIGMLAVAADFAGSRGAAAETVVWQALLVGLGGVIAAAMILIVLRGLVLRPLREVADVLGRLSRGEPSEAIPGVDDMSEELQEIARSVEALRTQAEQSAGAGGSGGGDA